MVTLADEVEVVAAEVAVMEAKEEADMAVMYLNRKRSLRKLTKGNAMMANKLTKTLLTESFTLTTKAFIRL